MKENELFNDIENSFIIFRDVVRKFPNRYKQNNEDIESLQKELQDYLHLLEFIDPNAFQGWRISKEIKRTQMERRKRKDENELLEQITPLLRKIKSDLKQMDDIVGKLRDVKEKQNNRSYRCKVRGDLQDSFDSNKLINF